MTMSLLNWLKKPVHLSNKEVANSVSATAIEGESDNQLVLKSHDDLYEPVDDPFPDNQGKTTSQDETGWLAQ